MDGIVTRRRFLKSTAAAGLGVTIIGGASAAEKPALLGGNPVRSKPFPGWPITDQREESGLLQVLKSGQWFRGAGKKVEEFEAAYARLIGAKHCLATANGTSALHASLSALDIGPGDEVIVPPYTFAATVNVVLMQYALPVFVDTDRQTHQIDVRKIEAAITDRTAAIIPVHLGGSAADMDALAAIAGKHKIPIIEDACQAVLGEWRGRKVGSLGTTGCFSFQNSKNLPSGEGGAILTNDDKLIEIAYAFHNNSRARQTNSSTFAYAGGRGCNLRMTEFQAALLLAQMTRLEENARKREQNARYLTEQLRTIPGIAPASLYEGCTRSAYHLYMFRYDAAEFAGLSRQKFLRALSAEGIPASSGYAPLNKESYIREAINSRGYRRIYGPRETERWSQRNQCPENDRLCQEGLWFKQTYLLGTRSDLDDIVAAIRKVQAHAAALHKA